MLYRCSPLNTILPSAWADQRGLLGVKESNIRSLKKITLVLMSEAFIKAIYIEAVYFDSHYCTITNIVI